MCISNVKENKTKSIKVVYKLVVLEDGVLTSFMATSTNYLDYVNGIVLNKVAKSMSENKIHGIIYDNIYKGNYAGFMTIKNTIKYAKDWLQWSHKHIISNNRALCIIKCELDNIKYTAIESNELIYLGNTINKILSISKFTNLDGKLTKLNINKVLSKSYLKQFNQ